MKKNAEMDEAFQARHNVGAQNVAVRYRELWSRLPLSFHYSAARRTLLK